MRYDALSLVQVSQAFLKKSKYGIEKSQPKDLKMASVLRVKRCNRSSAGKGKGTGEVSR